MVRKALYVIYNISDDENQKISDTDTAKFFKDLKDKNSHIDKYVNIDLQLAVEVKSSTDLVDKLDVIFQKNAYDEIYLHFSSHGQSKGINFGKWLLTNNDFTNLITDARVKFCFFSSCSSEGLAKEVVKKIPVTIGASTEIGNEFAIEFQKCFYANLFAKKTFLSAYNKTFTDVKKNDIHREAAEKYAEKNTPIVRGGGAAEDLDKIKINDLQIFFSEEKAQNNHLIYPSIVDKVNAISKKDGGLLVYIKDANLEVNFEKVFRKKGFHDNLELIFFKDEDIAPSVEGIDLMWSTPNIKTIVFITENEKLNERLKSIFDKRAFFDKSLDGGLRFVMTSDLGESTVFSSKFTYCATLSDFMFRFQSIKEEDISTLLDNDDFRKFITNTEIPFSAAERLTYKFPCKPSYKELRKIKGKNTFVQFFYIDESTEHIANYLINWIRRREKKIAPNLIINQRYKENQVLNVLLKEALSNDLANNKKLNGLLYSFIETTSQIIILKLDNEIGIDENRKSLKEIFKAFSNIKTMLFSENHKYPSYVFIFGGTGKEKIVFEDEEQVLSSIFPNTLNVVAEDVEGWQDDSGDEIVEIADKIEAISEKILKNHICEDQDKCPSEIIKVICDEFKIPSRQFLNIS